MERRGFYLLDHGKFRRRLDGHCIPADFVAGFPDETLGRMHARSPSVRCVWKTYLRSLDEDGELFADSWETGPKAGVRTGNCDLVPFFGLLVRTHEQNRLRYDDATHQHGQLRGAREPSELGRRDRPR